MPGYGPRTRDEILQATCNRLLHWLTSVGTIGDATSLTQVDAMAKTDVATLRTQMAPEDSRTLSDKDMTLVQTMVRSAAEAAHKILEHDSVWQRISRSATCSAFEVGEAGKTLLSQVVTMGTRDPALPPLPLAANSVPARAGVAKGLT